MLELIYCENFLKNHNRGLGNKHIIIGTVKPFYDDDDDDVGLLLDSRCIVRRCNGNIKSVSYSHRTHRISFRHLTHACTCSFSFLSL